MRGCEGGGPHKTQDPPHITLLTLRLLLPFPILPSPPFNCRPGPVWCQHWRRRQTPLPHWP